MDIDKHLLQYGIRSLPTEDAWVSCMRTALTPDQAARVDRDLAAIRGGSASREQLRAFYDYIAQPTVAGPMYSMRAGAIAASGLAVGEHLAGRRRVLDLGCGIGYLSTWFAAGDARREVVGVDVSPASITEARRRAQELGQSRVTFEVRDFAQTSIPGPFDAVVDCQAISFDEDPLPVLARVKGSLRPGGLLISLPPLGHAHYAREFMARLLQLGLGLRHFAWVRYRDIGVPGAVPLFVAELGARSISVDFEAQYQDLVLSMHKEQGPREG